MLYVSRNVQFLRHMLFLVAGYQVHVLWLLLEDVEEFPLNGRLSLDQPPLNFMDILKEGVRGYDLLTAVHEGKRWIFYFLYDS